MKTLTLLLALVFAFSTEAQNVKEKDILGTWKLVINVDEELEEEAEDADTILEEAIINSVSGLVSGILNNIDIYLEFRKNSELKIYVDAFGVEETEEGSWYINRKGYLVIEDEDDNDHINFSSDEDDEWRFEDGLLINNDDEDVVYMTRVD